MGLPTLASWFELFSTCLRTAQLGAVHLIPTKPPSTASKIQAACPPLRHGQRSSPRACNRAVGRYSLVAASSTRSHPKHVPAKDTQMQQQALRVMALRSARHACAPAAVHFILTNTQRVQQHTFASWSALFSTCLRTAQLDTPPLTTTMHTAVAQKLPTASSLPTLFESVTDNKGANQNATSYNKREDGPAHLCVMVCTLLHVLAHRAVWSRALVVAARVGVALHLLLAVPAAAAAAAAGKQRISSCNHRHSSCNRSNKELPLDLLLAVPAAAEAAAATRDTRPVLLRTCLKAVPRNEAKCLQARTTCLQ
jgi:hypothetical protein